MTTEPTRSYHRLGEFDRIDVNAQIVLFLAWTRRRAQAPQKVTDGAAVAVQETRQPTSQEASAKPTQQNLEKAHYGSLPKEITAYLRKHRQASMGRMATGLGRSRNSIRAATVSMIGQGLLEKVRISERNVEFRLK